MGISARSKAASVGMHYKIIAAPDELKREIIALELFWRKEWDHESPPALGVMRQRPSNVPQKYRPPSRSGVPESGSYRRKLSGSSPRKKRSAAARPRTKSSAANAKKHPRPSVMPGRGFLMSVIVIVDAVNKIEYNVPVLNEGRCL